MKPFLILLLMFCNTCKSECTEHSSGDKELYIFEYHPKIYGQAIICFLEINDSLTLQTSFKINYKEGEIVKIKKTVNTSKYKYQKRDDGNIYVCGLEVICYNSKNFNEKKKYNEGFYKLLSSSFLEIDNKERINILNKLSSASLDF